jgi:hypothetical protein
MVSMSAPAASDTSADKRAELHFLAQAGEIGRQDGPEAAPCPSPSRYWPEAGRRLGQIRMLVGINLIIGLVVITVASGGPYLII